MIYSWVIFFVLFGLFIAKKFIVSDLLSSFQNALNYSKFTKYIDLFFIFSSHIGFINRFFFYNAY